uniref:Uncharacterized protein n=1 Tax=Micrurus corallinus TaxID=54390 RepID=A0A2D4G0L6_MICCO
MDQPTSSKDGRCWVAWSAKKDLTLALQGEQVQGGEEMRAMPPQAEEESAILTTGTFREKTLWWLEMESGTLGEKTKRSRRRQATSAAQEEPEPEVHWARFRETILLVAA